MIRQDCAGSKNLIPLSQTVRQSCKKKTAFRNSIERCKGSEAESRCQSARDGIREQEKSPIRSRNRSVSPYLASPRLPTEFPLKKYRNLCSKIVFQLELIKNLSKNKTADAENLLDLRRQIQRADEFAIRFSRNNLYDTKRILNEIKNIPISDPKVLTKKIILGYQTASQSLQMYINFIKNPGNVEVPEKISELVLLIAELFLCCQNLCLPTEEIHVQNDAVKICNELLTLLKSKPAAGQYLGLKQENLALKKSKKPGEFEDAKRVKNLSMYETRCGKGKTEANPKKKMTGSFYLLGNKQKKMKKKDEKKAKITHDIYTQKLNPRQSKHFQPSKGVKFESGNRKEVADKSEIDPDKKQSKRLRYFTPREVRSQDDDVETMVQTIDNDELPTLRLEEFPPKSDSESEKSHINKASFRDLLLEAIEDLQGSGEKGQKIALKKLLNSIQNCVKSQTLRSQPSVKFFHFKHDYKTEEEEEQEGPEGKSEAKEKDGNVPEKKLEKPSAERRLKIIFRADKRRKENLEGEECNGKIPLKLNEDVMERLTAYKKSFADFTKDNLMYRKGNATRPWQLVEKVAEHIIADIIKEISVDFENDVILKHLYLNELFEAVHL